MYRKGARLISRRISVRSAQAPLSHVVVYGHWDFVLPQLMKHYNDSHRCLSLCKIILVVTVWFPPPTPSMASSRSLPVPLWRQLGVKQFQPSHGCLLQHVQRSWSILIMWEHVVGSVSLDAAPCTRLDVRAGTAPGRRTNLIWHGQLDTA